MFWELWHKGSAAGYKVKILTGDRDLFLIDPQKEVSVLYLSSAFIQRGGTGPTQVGLEQVKEKLGILPSQVVDYKALWDKSDNILGVKGIGENSGGFAQYHNTLDDIYASLAQIKGATAKKLKQGRRCLSLPPWLN